MKPNLEKLAKLSSRAEVQADAILTRLVNFPYSWIPAAIICVLAAVGAVFLAVKLVS